MTIPGVKLVLEDGTEMRGEAFGADAAGCRRGRLQHRDDRLRRDADRPVLPGPDSGDDLPAGRQLRRPARASAGYHRPPYESSRIQVQGLVVQNYVDRAQSSRRQPFSRCVARERRRPGGHGIDTRTLTRRLREHGTMRGWLLPAAIEPRGGAAGRRIGGHDERGVPRGRARTSRSATRAATSTILAVDIGAKDNIVRSLLSAGRNGRPGALACRPRASSRRGRRHRHRQRPGRSQRTWPTLVDQIRQLLGSFDKPIFGICLGNQILALAAGGDTYKLPYGHRGVNQPVQDLLTRRCYITSQNHGYAVQDAALPPDWEPWFVNINDGTNEGIRSRVARSSASSSIRRRIPGPKDTGFLFDDFLRLVGAMARR